MVKKLELSMYDLEQFLREAGAERVNEKAVRSLGRELEDTVKSLLEEASLYANYAGRKRLINASDIYLANKEDNPARRKSIRYKGRLIKPKRLSRKTGMPSRMAAPQIMLINNVPVIKEAPDISLQSQV